MLYVFGPFRADRAAYQVSRGERSLELTPKLLDLLFYLVERHGTLVTKEALLDGVWPGANVTENALAQAVSDLRDALGDSAAHPTYIRTIARRGYRFVADVRSVAPTNESPSPQPAAPTNGNAPRTIAVLDFANVTGDPDIAWLTAGIAETVTSDLAALDHFRVIDRWRVVQASRSGASMHDLGTALGAGLVVTGSYQRHGDRLRITARVVDLESGDAMADAKVDGTIDEIFALEDGIVRAFAHELGVAMPPAVRSVGVRETSSLEAYRAYTEGWLKIESLDTDAIRASIDDFERAIRLDPGYAVAHTGLANAQFVAYEMTRVTPTPDLSALATGIEHARHAIRLDGHLAEAHATLSFLLASASEFDAARSAAERAVTLEPDNWRHHYRLGHATWGHARLRALDRSLALYPGFSYAHFEAAMVHVARGHLDVAERIARDGVGEQDRHARSANRFPAIGFHWLSGAIAAATGRDDAALRHFDREISLVAHRRLYGPEYAATTLVARGHIQVGRDELDHALMTFRSALDHVPGHARAHLGEALTLERLGRPDAAASAWAQVRDWEDALLHTARADDARFTAACRLAVTNQPAVAVAALHEMLDLAPVSMVGWHLPIEPCFQGLRPRPDFVDVLAKLADRAT